MNKGYGRMVVVTTSLVFAASALAQPAMPNETGIEGTIMISPSHGGPIRVGESSARPLANTEFVVHKDGTDVRSFATDAAGHFQLVLPPGHYIVARKTKGKLGSCGPFEVEVGAGGMTSVQWTCDSGMR